MKKKLLTTMVIAASSLLVVGCGGNDSNGSKQDNNPTTPTTPTTPEKVTVNSIQILDANNQPIQNAEIKLLASSQWGTVYQQNADVIAEVKTLPESAAFTSAAVTTDAQGLVKVNGLNPDQYYISVKKGNETTTSSFVIKTSNAEQKVVLNVPFSCHETVCDPIYAIVGSLSGQVIVNGQPVKNAQVGLSGGAATNGAFVTALTDQKGHFNLSFNVSEDLAEALKNAKLLISADGYQSVQQVVPVYSSSSFGNQFTLVAATTNNEVVWRETFEPDSATVNQWEKSSRLEQPKWNLIQSNHNIKNNLVNVAVSLAPNDNSQGNVPTPPQGNNAYWYGDVASGNFIGELASATSVDDGATTTHMNGGTSKTSNYGALQSPVINLSQVKAPISLSFKTWWEIEAVNPNNNGFDIMDIQVSIDGGQTYQNLARLNPLSDPQSTANRAPLPFSNFGFNVAPSTSQQEAISLDQFAGQPNVRLKFEFSTEDELYNGFRGWMLDDVVIQKTAGTFPLFDEKAYPEDLELNLNSDNEVPVAKMLKSVAKEIAVKSRWVFNPQR